MKQALVALVANWPDKIHVQAWQADGKAERKYTPDTPTSVTIEPATAAELAQPLLDFCTFSQSLRS